MLPSMIHPTPPSGASILETLAQSRFRRRSQSTSCQFGPLSEVPDSSRWSTDGTGSPSSLDLSCLGSSTWQRDVQRIAWVPTSPRQKQQGQDDTMAGRSYLSPPFEPGLDLFSSPCPQFSPCHSFRICTISWRFPLALVVQGLLSNSCPDEKPDGPSKLE